VTPNSKPTSIKKNNYAYIVPAVDRAAQILSLLKEKARSMTIAEVTEATGWHKSSVHKILVTLHHHGLLDRNETTKQYSLGIALVGYGQFVMNNLNIRHQVHSLLNELSDYSGETANFSILNGKYIVVIQSVESKDNLRVTPPIGTMDPLTRKSNGKAVLASLPEEQVVNIIQQEKLPAFTRNSITTQKAFLKELEVIRKQGYATDYEEFQEGIHAVSAPVSNADGKVIGTVSIVGPASRMTKDKMHLYGNLCAKKALRITDIFRLWPISQNETDFADHLKGSI
jgi:DNA-binding IclR family transcriptional regulator